MSGAVLARSIGIGDVAVVPACPVTRSEGMYGNDALAAVIPEDGKFTFRPGGVGFVDDDGALGIKLAWDRRRPGDLFVGGRRLDASAPPARSYIPTGYGEVGGQSTYLVFPTPGCWEITGRVSDAGLTFVVLVEKIGDGPSWRMHGPQPGWRLTTGCSGPELNKVPSIVTGQCPAAEPGR